jgi:Flp pilus assembly protein CpaB
MSPDERITPQQAPARLLSQAERSVERKTRPWLLVLVVGGGVLLVLAAGAWLMLRLVDDRGGPAVGPPSIADTEILWVAAQDWPQGTVITEPEKMFLAKPFLKATVPPKAIVNLQDLKGKELSRSIDAGMPISHSDLGFLGDLFRPAPPGFRAVTVKLDPEASAAGFVFPGARVDVITAGQQDAKPSAKVILQNVLVLALTVPADKGKASVVTLAVKPEDGVTLAEATAAPGSKLTLLLRKPGDDAIIANPGAVKP